MRDFLWRHDVRTAVQYAVAVLGLVVLVLVVGWLGGIETAGA